MMRIYSNDDDDDTCIRGDRTAKSKKLELLELRGDRCDALVAHAEDSRDPEEREAGEEVGGRKDSRLRHLGVAEVQGHDLRTRASHRHESLPRTANHATAPNQ